MRASVDSADSSLLEFSVKIESITEVELVLYFDFVNPLSISTGSSPDVMRTTVIDPNIFVSKETGKALIGGFVSENEIPRQFENAESQALIEQNGKIIELSF